MRKKSRLAWAGAGGLAAVVSLAACSGKIEEQGGPHWQDIAPPSEGTPRPEELGPAKIDIAMLVGEHPRVPVATVQDGCRMWDGVECTPTSAPALARMEVYIDEGGCLPQDDGSVVIGRHQAYTPGYYHLVTVYVQCIAEVLELSPDEPIPHEYLRNVIAHEVGHALGMVRHVPHSCTEIDEDNPLFEDEAGAVCGVAMMNPFVDASLDAPTEQDWRNFDLRSVGYLYPYSVDKSTASEPGCALRAWPSE